MEARTLISSLLRCWWLDARYLIQLCDAYAHVFELADVMDDVDVCVGEKLPELNQIIYFALDCVALYFLEHVVKGRARRFRSTEYTIFTNSMDSWLWFDDPELNRWFESWRAF